MPASDKSYQKDIDEMESTFMKLANQSAGWQLVATRTSPPVEVYKLENTSNCFKIVATLDTSAETALDVLSDIRKRVEWDDLAEQGRVLQYISNSTRIDYLLCKAIWPTAARDAVLLSHIMKRRQIQVLHLPQHAAVVRMDAKIAGQIIRRISPRSCSVIQVADGDLKGWIPATVISFLATISVPGSFVKLNSILKTIPVNEKSQVLERIQKDEAPPPVASVPVIAVVKKKGLVLSSLAFLHSLVSGSSPWFVAILFTLKMYKILKENKLIS